MKVKAKIKFIPESKSPFYHTVKSRVDAYFKETGLNPHANISMVFKSIVMIALYIVPFILLLIYNPSTSISMMLWTSMGVAIAGIGMSVMHDANHGAYSKYPIVNYLMGHTLNLIGGSVMNWKHQHNILHHTYTNIAFVDEDIEDRLVLRFSPHSKLKFIHAFQWLYAIIFYGLLTFYWAIGKDFVQYFKHIKSGVNPYSKKENNINLLKIIAIKLVYFSVIFGLPLYINHTPIYLLIIGFGLMHSVSGIILTVVFQLAHTVEGTTHPLPNEKGIIENDWAIHQMNTTVDFSRNNPFITWYVGGLNFQVEHHLFPHVCHVHYPAISKIVEQTAKEFNVPYLVNKTLFDALSAHFKAMYRFGREESETSLQLKKAV